jgi:putative solute:sodium symporter small subunit
VRNSSESAWWRETRQLALTVAIVLLVVAFLPVLLEGHIGDRLIIGMRFSTFAGTVVAPLVALAAAFVFAARQRYIDRRHDVADS